MKKRKILKILKILGIMLVIILFLEFSYYMYSLYLKPSKSIYFDSLNDMEAINKGFIAVGSNNNNENYYEKAKITKYNSKREKVFERIYNKGYNGVFFGVCSDNDGFIAVGSYEDNKEELDKSLRSALIVKYDNSGNIVFESRFQVLGNSRFMDVVAVDDGYLVVGQSVYNDMTLGFSKAGGAYIIKYNNLGEIVWKSNYGDNKNSIYNSLLVLNDYIYVVGRGADSVGLLSKYSLDGALVATVSYEYSDKLGFTDITSVDDRIVVSGSKMIDDNQYVALVASYSLDLDYMSEASYDDKTNSRFNRLIRDSNNDLILVGNVSYLDKNKKDKEISILKYDGLVAKYKNDLKSIKVVETDGERDDHFTDIVQDEDSYLVCGYSLYEDQSYMSKFIKYSDALKVLEVE